MPSATTPCRFIFYADECARPSFYGYGRVWAGGTDPVARVLDGRESGVSGDTLALILEDVANGLDSSVDDEGVLAAYLEHLAVGRQVVSTLADDADQTRTTTMGMMRECDGRRLSRSAARSPLGP